MVPRPRRTGVRIAAALLSAVVVCAGPVHGYDNGSHDPAARARALWKEGAGLHLEADYHGAIARYRRALQLYPTARTHTYLAWSLSKLGRYREAVGHCRSAIELDPGYPNAYNDIGAYLVELGQPGEAIPWLRKAIGFRNYCCPHYAHYQLARALVLQARVEEARRELEASLSIRPDFKVARQLLRRLRDGGFQGL